MTLAFSHLVFVYIRCIQIELKLIPVSKYQLIYVRSMGVFYSLGAILHFGVIYKKTDIVQFLNQVMETIQNFERKNVGGSTKAPKIITDIELVMQMVKYSFGGAWLVFTILVSEIQGLARSIDSKGSKNKSTLLVCTCRWFCMYVDIACEIYTEVVLPVAQMLLIVNVVFCTYGAVKMEGIPSLGLGLLGLFAFGFLTVLFTLMTEVHDRASAAKLYWKGCGIADPWLRRALQAMPVKSLKLAGTYIIDRQIVLTMVDVILSQTVTFLLVNP
ncbi:unnamed protein product [Allacma fusca]|uniref:Uncharacterized protein n=1 Tax=Allacma fusca TaxID=39272 RepID=A0A8J2J750_9HEXA|nr:unnamed protein product [Allacma fusca]